jgi:hypothetical protein
MKYSRMKPSLMMKADDKVGRLGECQRVQDDMQKQDSVSCRVAKFASAMPTPSSPPTELDALEVY